MGNEKAEVRAPAVWSIQFHFRDLALDNQFACRRAYDLFHADAGRAFEQLEASFRQYVQYGQFGDDLLDAPATGEGK